MTSTPRANLIARTVISQFNKLPPKRKPCIRNNGIREWVPLSGIVAEHDGQLTCLALATGMKCLPASRLSEASGNAIHDWHAEVLTMRTFNRFLLDECNLMTGTISVPSQILQFTDPESRNHNGQRFRIRENVKLHMYCSEAPCGDASMELIMAAQDDASPWDTPAPLPATNSTAQPDVETSLPGRAYFSQLGVVRRKPARGDAPPTLSKSCSDKITLKQCTSLLSSLTSLFVEPSNAYIDTLVLPSSQYSAAGCQRAFSDRVAGLLGKSWPGGYAFNPFTVETTDEEFEFSRKVVQDAGDKIGASNLAAAWSASCVEESIIGGVIQGRKPFDSKGASRMSRRRMWGFARDVANRMDDADELRGLLGSGTYQEVKDASLLADRRRVKDEVRCSTLKGWIRNEGDAAFSLRRCS